MEQMMKCPLCGTENKRTYYSEDVGLVEDHYACMHCGYTEEMAYSPVYVGIDTAIADDGVWPSPKRMWELAQAEKDGRLVAQKATPGKQVWIIERDECGEACEISGYMFLASTGNAVIATAYINSLEGLEETLDYHIQETAENYDTDLAVFPAEDCYLTRAEAEEALKKEDK